MVPVMPGKPNFEPGGQNRDQQVADKLRDILAGRPDGAVQQHTRPRHDDQADKHLGAQAQFSPRLRAATHVPPLGFRLSIWGESAIIDIS